MSFFQSGDGTQLHERVWPRSEPLAHVVIVHGYGEHIGRYDETARVLNDANFSVSGFDLRGHGQSSGARGFCRRFDEYIDDLDAAVARAQKKVPLFLLGHSFGGLIAPHYALRKPASLTGLVLTSPFWRIALAVPTAKALAGKIASRLYPGLALPTGFRGADVSRDPDVIAAYDADPLNNKVATARWFTEATQAQEALVARAPSLSLPILILAGEADRLADAKFVPTVFAKLGGKDKTLRMLAGQFHEVLNEPPPDRQRTQKEIVEWLRAHARKSAVTVAGKLRAQDA
jgi:alpha-beta hydrolase superfamily lysophospholipase